MQASYNSYGCRAAASRWADCALCNGVAAKGAQFTLERGGTLAESHFQLGGRRGTFLSTVLGTAGCILPPCRIATGDRRVILEISGGGWEIQWKNWEMLGKGVS